MFQITEIIDARNFSIAYEGVVNSVEHNFSEQVVSWLGRNIRKDADYQVDSLEAAVATGVGNVRKENQDCAIVARYSHEEESRSFVLCALCDGVGGLEAGAQSSKRVIALILEDLVRSVGKPSYERLKQAVLFANDQIYREYDGKSGTTLSCILNDGTQQPVAINVGDSRIYQISINGRCNQLSVDDNIENQLRSIKGVGDWDKSLISGEQITQYIGIGEDLEPNRVHLLDSEEGRGYLLTSDGVHGMSEKTFNEICFYAPTPRSVVQRLSAIARWGGAHDNASVICIKRTLPQHCPNSKNNGFLSVWSSYGQLDIVAGTQLQKKTLNQKVEGNQSDLKSFRSEPVSNEVSNVAKKAAKKITKKAAKKTTKKTQAEAQESMQQMKDSLKSDQKELTLEIIDDDNENPTN